MSEPPPAADVSALPTPAQRRGMRAAIAGQTFGCLAATSFTNGLLLLYLAKQGLGSASALLLLSLPSMIQPPLVLPLAFIADHTGRRRMLLRGAMVGGLGFAVLTAAASWTGTRAAVCAALGITLYAIGSAQLNATWYSLLSAVVPPTMRGSFFGTLRLTWQLAALGFGVACASLLAHDSSLRLLQGMFGVIAISLAIRSFLFRGIAELDRPEASGARLIDQVTESARSPGYAAFCCYVFLLTLVTANVAALLPLIERESIGFGDRLVLWMGNLLAFGSVVGFFLGGRLVDRVGTKPMFLICHGAFGAIFVGVVARPFVPIPEVIWLGALNAAYGVVMAGSSVAISTEMLALAPPTYRSVSTGLCNCLLLAGAGLAGLLSSAAIKLGVFSEHWTIGSATLSAYDTILLGNGVLVVLLIVTLGLVPSVMRKAEWTPKAE
jgi:MFS family permease